MNQKTRDDGRNTYSGHYRGRGGRRRSDYAGATAPVRLGARRHHSAHGAQRHHVMESKEPTTIMPNGA